MVIRSVDQPQLGPKPKAKNWVKTSAELIQEGDTLRTERLKPPVLTRKHLYRVRGDRKL